MLNLSYIMKQLHCHAKKCSSDEDGSKITAALLLLYYLNITITYYYHTSFGQPKMQNWDEVK